MNERVIYVGLTEIFREVFSNPVMSIDAGTNAEQIEDWDSFAQVNIIVAVEARFGVRIRSVEAQKLKNVGDLVRLIHLKRA